MGHVNALLLRQLLMLSIFCLLWVTGCERYELDRKMDELCKKDGGVRVYEIVSLSPEEHKNIFNYVATARDEEVRYGPNYKYVREREIFVGGDNSPEKGQGELVRWHSALYRRSDNRLLGESVSYDRRGGDLFTFGFQSSGNLCPHLRLDLALSVFLKGD